MMIVYGKCVTAGILNSVLFVFTFILKMARWEFAMRYEP
jgi:hypothetical protein